jgi:hypothetical protein
MRQLWKRAGSFGKLGGACKGSAHTWERALTTPRLCPMPLRGLHQCRPNPWVCASRDGGRDNLGLEKAPDRWIRPEAGDQAERLPDGCLAEVGERALEECPIQAA